MRPFALRPPSLSESKEGTEEGGGGHPALLKASRFTCTQSRQRSKLDTLLAIRAAIAFS